MTLEGLLGASDFTLQHIARFRGLYNNGLKFFDDRQTIIEELTEDLDLLDLDKRSIQICHRQYEFTDYLSYFYEPSNQTHCNDFVFNNRYGKTRITFLQRDPLWGLVDWEISSLQLKNYKEMKNYKEIFLRISCYTKKAENKFQLEEWQDTFLYTEYGHQYVQFIRREGDCWHQVELVIEAHGHEFKITKSAMLLTSVSLNIQDDTHK